MNVKGNVRANFQQTFVYNIVYNTLIMHYKFFASSQKSWKAMFDSILLAKKTIYLEMYIFQDDMIDFDFLKLLKEKSREGVKVKMILDSFGSYNLSKVAVSEIRESGIELFFLSYFLHRTHRKILIVDQNVAFLGGVNFHQSASLWNDLVVRVKGRLVNSITKSFAKVYAECGGKDVLILQNSKNGLKHGDSIRKNKMVKVKEVKEKVQAWLIDHSPVKNRFNLKKLYQKHLSDAKESILIVTPYFMPKRWLIGALHQAYLRGVDVEILVPLNTDYYIIDRVNYFYINKLSKLGIKFCLETQMNHAKITVIDSKEGIVGSNNLDYLSFELNSEVGIFFKDQLALNRILKIIEGWKRNTVIFDAKVHKRQWFDYILAPLISLFSRVL